MTDFLSDDEIIRLGGFKSVQAHDTYLVGRVTLRRVIGRYLDCDPKDLRIAAGQHGKPILVEQRQRAQVEFNVSHAEQVVGISVARRPVGFDVESTERCVDIGALSQRVMSVAERAAIFSNCGIEAQRSCFLRYWTRKEAVLKRDGCGLSRDPTGIETAESMTQCGRIFSFAPRPGYIASVAGSEMLTTISLFDPAHGSEPTGIVPVMKTKIPTIGRSHGGPDAW